jgi:hypothetical protein
MPTLEEDEVGARSIGLVLLDASGVYEDFLIPRRAGLLRRQRFPEHSRAIIGLIGRQRRFLRATYMLADGGLMLEAIGPLRSMFEFLVTQRWLARDPDRNWKLWMEQDHARRDLWRRRFGQRAPALHDAAAASLTAAQRHEGEEIAAVRAQVKAELGDQQPEDTRTLEQRAQQVGLSFLYDAIYRYASAATHPTLFAVDLLSEKHPKGLLLRREPTAQLASLSPYLHGALLLHESLQHGAELAPVFDLKELASLGRNIHALIEQRASARIPNWRELLPAEAFKED